MEPQEAGGETPLVFPLGIEYYEPCDEATWDKMACKTLWADGSAAVRTGLAVEERRAAAVTSPIQTQVARGGGASNSSKKERTPPALAKTR